MCGCFVDFEHPCVLKKLIILTLLSLLLVYIYWRDEQNTIGIFLGHRLIEMDDNCNLNFFQTASEQYQRYINNSFHNSTLPPSSLKNTKQVNKWHQEQTRKFEVTVSIKETKSMFHLQVTIVDYRNSSQGGASFKLNFEGKHFLASYSIKDFYNGTYYGCYYLPTDWWVLLRRDRDRDILTRLRLGHQRPLNRRCPDEKYQDVNNKQIDWISWDTGLDTSDQ